MDGTRDLLVATLCQRGRYMGVWYHRVLVTQRQTSFVTQDSKLAQTTHRYRLR